MLIEISGLIAVDRDVSNTSARRERMGNGSGT